MSSPPRWLVLAVKALLDGAVVGCAQRAAPPGQGLSGCSPDHRETVAGRSNRERHRGAGRPFRRCPHR
jgi:hypothetical protein